MKKLHVHDGSSPSSQYMYRIDEAAELDAAILDMCEDYSITLAASFYGVGEKPEHYPYVVVMQPDDEYGRVDFSFISAGMLLDELEPGSLLELRGQLYSYTSMKAWIDRLNEQALEGERTVEFTDLDDEPNFTNERALNNAQADWLRDRGYKVQWEKYPRSWIVSGWV